MRRLQFLNNCVPIIRHFIEILEKSNYNNLIMFKSILKVIKINQCQYLPILSLWNLDNRFKIIHVHAKKEKPNYI